MSALRRARTAPGGSGSRWMTVRYPGACKVCGAAIAAGERAFWDAPARTVTCWSLTCCEADGLTRQQWQGSPVSGGYVSVRADRRIGSCAR